MIPVTEEYIACGGILHCMGCVNQLMHEEGENREAVSLCKWHLTVAVLTVKQDCAQQKKKRAQNC
jgi:hypothetical protein